MTIPNSYTAQDLNLGSPKEIKGLYKIPVDYTNQEGQKKSQIFETYDARIKDILKNTSTLSMQILERGELNDVASINGIDGLLKNIEHGNDNNVKSENSLVNNNALKCTLTIEIKSGVSKGLNRGKLSPVSLVYKGKTGVFTLSNIEQIETYPFGIGHCTLSIFSIGRNGVLVKLGGIEGIVTGEILDIIQKEISSGS